MKNIYELLEMIRQRPGMYLGQRSLLPLPQEIRIVHYTTDSGFYRFDVSPSGEISEIGYLETEKLAMEEVYKEFQVYLDEWEALNII